MLATTGDPLSQVEKAQGLLKDEPLAFVAIISLAVALYLGRALLKEKDKRAEPRGIRGATGEVDAALRRRRGGEAAQAPQATWRGDGEPLGAAPDGDGGPR